jgi:Zn-dependent alcohol dehydrogenase
MKSHMMGKIAINPTIMQFLCLHDISQGFERACKRQSIRGVVSY